MEVVIDPKLLTLTQLELDVLIIHSLIGLIIYNFSYYLSIIDLLWGVKVCRDLIYLIL